MTTYTVFEIDDVSIDDALTPTFPHLMTTTAAGKKEARKRLGWEQEERKDIKKAKGCYVREVVNLGRGGETVYWCYRE